MLNGFRFACWENGKLMEDPQEFHFIPKYRDDAWLIRQMDFSYRGYFGRHPYLSLRTIGFAKYIRVSFQNSERKSVAAPTRVTHLLSKFESHVSEKAKKAHKPPRKRLIKGKEMYVTTQQGIEDYKPESSIHNFEYRFHHPPRKGTSEAPQAGLRKWLERMEQLAGQARGDTYFIIELFEAPNTR